MAALLTASLSCMDAGATDATAIALLMAAWGAAYGALPVLLQTLVFKQASKIPGAADAATSINVSVFNAAIGLGSLLGGLLINLNGPRPIPHLATCFALAGFAAILVSREKRQR
ncbi:MAG: sugar efflux transporter [Stenotrophomonas maltophilia]|uniref:Sugar efflux transporter n=1 Tax=Stenotrophomonas maltophilia TaxID=40324 RepID=A0A7V8FDP8_STEMA|nr:MAG: sugar efflux transporter [Stenotrophomonas maltophilia]